MIVESNPKINLLQINGTIEWYRIKKTSFRGFCNKEQKWLYNLNKSEESGMWILTGEGLNEKNEFRNILMEKVGTLIPEEK